MRNTTTRRSRALRYGAAAPVLGVGLLVLAACGSGGGSASPSDSQGSTGMTVTTRDAGGMSVLTTSTGRTLYVSDQEHGKVLCTSGACGAIWSPLTASAGHKPTAPASVASDLSTIKRPDGSAQVAFDGQPLYTFSFDHSTGQVNGNGVSDNFDGTDFTWHAATPSGASGSPDTSTSNNDNGYRY